MSHKISSKHLKGNLEQLDVHMIKTEFYKLYNMNIICHMSRLQKWGGGVGFYINETYKYIKRNDFTIFKEITSESLFIEIDLSSTNNILICVIYRPTNGN